MEMRWEKRQEGTVRRDRCADPGNSLGVFLSRLRELLIKTDEMVFSVQSCVVFYEAVKFQRYFMDFAIFRWNRAIFR